MSLLDSSSPAAAAAVSDNERITAAESLALVKQFFPGENVQVSRISFKPFSDEKLGFLGVHEQLSIEVCVKNGVKTLTFFVKSVIPTPNAFDELIFKEESAFYRDLIPRLLQSDTSELWAANCYLVKHNLFVLEDLRSQGYKVINRIFSRDELNAAVQSLACFHASSMLLEERLNRPLNELYPGYWLEKTFKNDAGGLIWQWLATGIEVVEAVAEKLGLQQKSAALAYASMLEKVKPRGDCRNVLSHCDLWCNNMMFKRDNDDNKVTCRFIDFQMCTYTSYAIDFVQLIYLNTRRDDRNLPDYMRIYHETLNDNLSRLGTTRLLTRSEIQRDIEEKRICGMVTAVQYLPIALLDESAAAEYSSDTKTFELYNYTSRKEFVLGVMNRDEVYRCRLEEAVRELCEFVAEERGDS